jgi:REP element-mobilizing transposase RayT
MQVFRDPVVVNLVNTQIVRTAAAECFAVLAYCFMPDHVHLLVRGLTREASLERFAKMTKQRSGALYTRRYRAPLWQTSYHDRVLREREHPRGIAQYILENPVRAGLDLPHSPGHSGPTSRTWPGVWWGRSSL